jgi:hypothetical protein
MALTAQKGFGLIRAFFQANVAQLVEQLTRNEQVSGSNPLIGSTCFQRHFFLAERQKRRKIHFFPEDSLLLCGDRAEEQEAYRIRIFRAGLIEKYPRFPRGSGYRVRPRKSTCVDP